MRPSLGATVGEERVGIVVSPPAAAISRAKLNAPAAPADYIERAHLYRLLDGAFERRLTTVIAGAGFGKSTLLAGWARARSAAWYSLDATDLSLNRFVSGLAHALRVPVDDLFAYSTIGLGAQHDDQVRAEPFGAFLCDRVEEALDIDVVLVLDDVHELGARGPAVRMLSTICRNAPVRLHLVLSSRLPLPFGIERLRGRGEVLELDASELALSPGEVGALIQAPAGERGATLAAELHRHTRGWAAAVRLAGQALHSASSFDHARILEELDRRDGPLFPYLASEVFAREPPLVRDVVTRCALFDRFSPELCEALGLDGVTPAFERLRVRGLLIRQDDASSERGWLALHPLLRAFAAERWPLDKVAARKLRLRAALWFEQIGEIEEALRQYGLASAHESVVRVVVDDGDPLITSGRAESVVAAAETVPTEDRPALFEAVLGDAYLVSGRGDEADGCFDRAAKGRESVPAGLAWRMAFCRRGPAALDACLRGEITGEGTRDEAVLLGMTACAYYVASDADNCAIFAARALDAARAAGDDRAAAWGHHAAGLAAVARGDTRSAEEHFRSGMDAAERAGDVAKAIHLAVNLAVTEIYSGRYSDALAHLDRAIEGAELFGLSTYVSWGLGVRGWARSRLGPSDESLLDCERALELFHGHSGQTAAPLIAMGDARRERGDLASAQAAYDEAIRRTTGQGDLQLLAPALAGLARTIAGDEPARARDLAERAVALPAGEHRAWVLCSAGWVVLADGDLERAQELAAEALDVAGGRYPDRAVLPEALELTVLSAADPTAETPRLDEARALWLDLPNELAAARVEYILARLGGQRSHRAATRAIRRMQTLAGRADVDGRAAGPMMALGPADPPLLSIETLGRFRVLQRGEVLPPEAWRSRKARDLLKLLIARRGRGVPRDALIEALWPDDDPAKTANRLAVALSTVRTVLDPARRLPLNHYIGATGDAVALDLNTVAVDVEGFLADAQAGLSARGKDRDDEAVALLEAAEAAYYGDFLEESVYEDWAIDLREEARAAYAAVVTALAEHARARGDYDAETQYRLRVLERDRHDEGAHLALVSAFVAQGRHGEARRAYRGYATRMDEIGLEPAPFPLG